jgi:hypothetical protein
MVQHRTAVRELSIVQRAALDTRSFRSRLLRCQSRVRGSEACEAQGVTIATVVHLRFSQ